jgi:catecholate siderophore receptor
MLDSMAVFMTLALALADAPAPAFRLEGRVLDPTLAPISGAVVAADKGSGEPVRTTTDASGAFTLALAPGDYRVTVRAPGFHQAIGTVEARERGTSATREFVLDLAARGESVTVRSSGGYGVDTIASATKTLTPLIDVPQSVTVTTKELVRDQLVLSVGDAMRYVPGIQVHQGENNRDQVVIRGNGSSADFFLNGVRDDVQYYRDLYNVERIEALKGPNAMMFGRGGGGGVVNRVTKEAVFVPVREMTAQVGGYGHRRVAADFGEPLGPAVALRLNAMYEDSDSMRRYVGLERWALNPTLTFTAGPRTRVTVGYERLSDDRVADRGITSYQGRPADVDPSTYYGNPDDSRVRARVDIVTATLEQQAGRATVRNRTMFGLYDRFYQNYVPGAVTADKSRVAVTAYNNATQRDNLFSQTDLILPAATGRLKHRLLAGFELGRQQTDNFRNTGYFDGGTSLSLPYSSPRTSVAASFRQSATDADNHVRAGVAAAYIQDQVELSRHLQLVAGLRLDRFDLAYDNHRNGDRLARADGLLSPRAGVVVKPVTDLSLYGSYTVSHLPSSGDQFSSLTVVTEQLEPERFDNYELGVKWEARPGLAVTSALYRLDRTNTRSTDPNDPTRIVQTGRQRTTGVELGLSGRVTSAWQVAGGYAYQDARVTSATAAARAGARVAQVPRHSFSLWNHVQIRPRVAAALGILYRGDVYAAIDNTVTLPAYTRIDVAAYYSLSRALRLQANVENALDRRYWSNADGNTNITPGFGRTLRVALAAAF